MKMWIDTEFGLPSPDFQIDNSVLFHCEILHLWCNCTTDPGMWHIGCILLQEGVCDFRVAHCSCRGLVLLMRLLPFIPNHLHVHFQEYLQQIGDPKNIDDITKDLHRQFPNHEMFLSKGGHGYVWGVNCHIHSVRRTVVSYFPPTVRHACLRPTWSTR